MNVATTRWPPLRLPGYPTVYPVLVSLRDGAIASPLLATRPFADRPDCARGQPSNRPRLRIQLLVALAMAPAIALTSSCEQRADVPASPKWVITPPPDRAPEFERPADVRSIEITRFRSPGGSLRLDSPAPIARVLETMRKSAERNRRGPFFGLPTETLTLTFADGSKATYHTCGGSSGAWQRVGQTPAAGDTWGDLSWDWDGVLDALEWDR